MLGRLFGYLAKVAFCAIMFPLFPLMSLGVLIYNLIKPSPLKGLPLSSGIVDPEPWKHRWAIPPALVMTCATVATIPQFGWGSLLAGLGAGVIAGAILGAFTVSEWP